MNHASDAIYSALIASLYAESLVLADEARAWFEHAHQDRYDDDQRGSFDTLASANISEDDPAESLRRWAGRYDPSLRIALSCESLRLTTRLMHVIAWLLLHRAIAAGELAAGAAKEPSNRLGPSPATDTALLAQLPCQARRMIEASERLHQRVAQLDVAMCDPALAARQPVNDLIQRLQSAI